MLGLLGGLYQVLEEVDTVMGWVVPHVWRRESCGVAHPIPTCFGGSCGHGVDYTSCLGEKGVC